MKNNRSNAFKSGSYSALLTVVVVLIALFVNVLIGALPSKFTELDLSSKKLYSVTATTKAVLSNVDEDLDIYLVCQAGQEDAILKKLLEKYAEYNSKINFEVINPDVYPTFAKNYTTGEVTNNDVIVDAGSRYKYIPFTEIYDVDTKEYYTNGTYKTYFDGESELTSAIDYVTREDLPKLYILTGHGEGELPETLSNAITKANIDWEEISVVKSGNIPNDADMVMLWGPQSDISEKEKEIIVNYVNNGGKLLAATAVVAEGLLENETALLSEYGIDLVQGFVMEENQAKYAFGYPYILLPELESSDITDDLIADKYAPVTAVTQGAIVNEVGDAHVTKFLTTTESSYSKTEGFSSKYVEREDIDADGPFALAASIDNLPSGAKIVWYGTTNIADATYNSYSSGANMKMFMNSLSWLSEENTISIVSKSVDYDYLTIKESQASMLKLIMLIIIPAVFLLMGIVELIFRRKLK